MNAPSLLLAAGFYQLIVFSLVDPGPESDPNSAMGGVATWNFDLQLEETTTQAPEPFTHSLLALGLVGSRAAKVLTTRVTLCAF